MTTIAEPPVLEVQGVSKRFAGVLALADVSVELRAGQVHALVGENGAGKSTLIKVLTGVHQPDQGAIVYRGEPVGLRQAAGRAGGRDQHDLPGGEPGPADERRAEPVPRPRADRRASGSSTSGGCIAKPAPASRGTASMSTSASAQGAGPRRAADGRHRARDRRRSPGRHHGRADLLARATRGRAPDGGRRSPAPRTAWRSSTSRTGSTRSSGCATW